MYDNATKNDDYISEFFWSRQVPTEQKGLLVSDSTPPIIIMSSMTIEQRNDVKRWMYSDLR